MRRLIVIVGIFILAPPLQAQQANSEHKVYVAERINPAPPVIDGILNDAAWQKENWEDEFIQREPYEGAAPSQQTAFMILYDDENIYVAVRIADTELDKIARRMTRRDQIDGDWVRIMFDSFFDHRTAFGFGLTASGVKADAVISNDGEIVDYNWDPVWYAQAAADESGWTAEMRIPLNQLRFAGKDEQVWGLQVERFLYRKEETSSWQHIPRDVSGWVSRYGELRGISDIKSARRIEILPYTVGKTETSLKEAGNPFKTGSANSFLGGLDGKIGVTSDLTLDLTVNPDFGQVEADPSVVNLSAYEIFFEEKRPFFVEGKNILNFQIMGGDGDFSQDNLFYSRRIGRTPHYDPADDEEDAYVNMPQKTNIAAALKLSGKTRSGVSVGVMEAVTVKETAGVASGGVRKSTPVEPLTNYFISRFQKDYRKGNTLIGGMITATNRDITDEHLNFLATGAYSGGFDFEHNWKDKTYFVSLKTLFSTIRGGERAILRAQRASARYFQRPDAGYVAVDSAATSMSGHGGTLAFGKIGSGYVRFSAGTTWRSPGLELNDIGYLRQSDVVLQWFWTQYQEWNPRWIFRNYSINFNQWRGWNFGSENIFDGGNINLNMQFKNYWNFGMGVNRQGESLAKSMLRGGPSLRINGGWNSWFNIDSDNRKDLLFGLNGAYSTNDDGISGGQNFNPRLTWRPHNTLSITGNLFYNKSIFDLQYVATRNTDGGKRYIFGKISQKTAGLVLRIDCALTPNLTVQYYGQPFVSAGDYTNFRKITSPRADDYTSRFHEYSGSEIAYDADDESYSITEGTDRIITYSFDDPDFNFRQFQSNLVVRWEYTPGSTLFLVWTQSRTGSYTTGNFSFNSDMRSLFDIYPDNIFLVKFNHWFSL